MKDLILPKVTSNQIPITEIDSYFNGIIICYKDGITCGSIVFIDGEWSFSDSISQYDGNTVSEENLADLIIDLITDRTITNCKVIEYGSID